jgi:hypothetical protein
MVHVDAAAARPHSGRYSDVYNCFSQTPLAITRSCRNEVEDAADADAIVFPTWKVRRRGAVMPGAANENTAFFMGVVKLQPGAMSRALTNAVKTLDFAKHRD